MQALDTYDPVERYVGNDSLDEYEFQFLITEAAQLLVIVLDDSDEEIERFRGNESNDFMDSLEFDETNGGGTIHLADELPTGYTLILMLAGDEPVQTSNFTAVGVFSMSYLQAALNKIGSFLQRASWLAQRGIRLHDAHNDTFDTQLPLELENGRTIVINETGTGLQLGPTIEELLQASADAADAEAAMLAAQAAQLAAENAQIAAELAETNAETAASNAAGSAAAALVSENNAETAETNAEAAQAAAEAAQAAAELAETNAETAETNAETAETNAEAAQVAAEAAQAAAEAAVASIGGGPFTGPFTANQNASTALTGEVTDSGDYTMVEYYARIVRGTTVFGMVRFVILFRNGAWELASEMDIYADAGAALGVTFTVHAITAQITAVVDNSGAGNATIDLRKVKWAA